MLFSILIPVYNVELYLKECLDSIMNQTEQDFEVILVNDGSTDSSGSICDEYANKYLNKIKVFHQENIGLLLTRRRQIKLAQGDYCIFVDSDDYLRLDTLEVIKKYIVKHDCDMLMHKFIIFENKGKNNKLENIFNQETIFEGAKKRSLYTTLLLGDGLNNLWGKAIKRSIIEANKSFDSFSFIKNTEGLIQILPIITNAKKIVSINDELYFYRINPNGIVRTFKRNFYTAIKCIHNELIYYSNIWDSSNIYIDNVSLKTINSIYNQIIKLSFVTVRVDTKTIKICLKEIGEDDFFINLYQKIDKKEFSYKKRFVLWLVYKEQYSIILLLICIKRLLN